MILVTGFEPFANHADNPSREIAKAVYTVVRLFAQKGRVRRGVARPVAEAPAGRGRLR